MPSKTEEYLALAQRTANGLTRYWEHWTDYLTTASRLYKYSFADQLMIYAQRPDATACASFDIWNNRMNRYVRRGSKGIALLDQSSSVPRLHYVFDVSDTGVRRNSRDPEVWQLNDDLFQPVSEMLAREYGIHHERLSQQIADIAGKLAESYDSNRNKENTSLKKEKYLQRIQCYPEFSEKPIALITKKDCDSMIRFIEDSDARVYKRAVLKPEAKEFKTVSCPKIAKECTIREETIERIFRGETVSLDSAQQVATALGKTVEQMFEVEIDRRPMTKKTMREYNLFIRSVLNYANDNYGTSLQMPMIKASGRKGKSVDCLHSDEVEALQAALQECSMLEKAIVLCLLNTGVRRGELAGLTWKDVNFREGTIHVSKSLLVFPNYGYQLTTTKESNIRDVDVAPEFMDFLKDYYAQWKAQKKLMGASWQKNLEKKGSKYAQSLLDLRGNDFVICNDYGFPINPDSYGALVRRVGKKAGIEKIHPHMFRHTFVSILLSNPNIGVATVAAEAGHAQPSTTLAIYTQVYDRRRDEIRKQMSRELYK